MPRIPSYRLHRPSGLGVVTLSGHDHYLGPYGDPDSRRRYDRLVGAWIAAGRRPLEDVRKSATVAELCAAFASHAKGWYRKNGKPTTQLPTTLGVLRELETHAGDLSAEAFGPKRLVALREMWVRAGLSRIGVNRRAGIVKQLYRWAAEMELVPGETYHALHAVRGLAAGRTAAPERPPVGPVEASHLDATLGVLAPRWASLVRLQLASGMRPGEAVPMRPCDLDRSRAVWLYTPASHKTEHHGKVRPIWLGPRARLVLGPLLEVCGPGDYLFPPRPTGRWPAARARKKGRAEHVSVICYRNAIHRACDRAGVPRWHPNQLRHVAATAIRAAYGLEAARVVLGHSSAVVSEVYAERDQAKAAEIAEKLG